MTPDTNSVLTKNEISAWESFEVGSYDEVIEMSKRLPSPFLKHLAILSEIENSGSISELEVSGLEKELREDSILLHLVNSYHYYYQKNYKEALRSFIQYLKTPGRLYCLTIFQYGIKLSFEREEYKICLHIMDLDKDGINDQYYYNEKLSSLFALKKYNEVIQYFKKIHNFINMDEGVYIKTALSLQALGKFKESELLLKKVPNRKELPSFEDKQIEFGDTIKNLSVLEKKEDLSYEELKELGFAYLFTSQYEKAEELFKKATVSLATG